MDTPPSSKAKLFKFKAKIPLSDPKYAQMIAKTISVDTELRPHLVDRTVSAQGCSILVDISSSDLNVLRIVSNSILRSLYLTIQTLGAFAFISDDKLLKLKSPLPDCAMKL